MKTQVVIRSVADLEANKKLEGLNDPEGIALREPGAIRAFVTNPSLISDQFPAELLGVAEGRICAGVRCMPIRISADGNIYESSANPNTIVSTQYRHVGFAIDILEFGLNSPRDNIRLDYYVSKRARKAIKLFGGHVFDIRQFAIVKGSSVFLRDRFKIHRSLTKVMCFCVDFVMFFHRALLRLLTCLKTIGWKMEIAEADEEIAEFSKMIAEDERRFKVLEDGKFIRWILENDFTDIRSSNKHLWKIQSKGRLLGFVMTRHNNGERGRILDWQVTPEIKHKEALLLLFAALKLIHDCKSVVISVSAVDRKLVDYFSRMLPPLPLQAATIGAGADSPILKHEGWDNPANWRIRPTMGDSGLF